MNRDPNSKRPAAEGETPRKKEARYSYRHGCVEWEPAVKGPECRAALQLKKEELKSAFNTNDMQVRLQPSIIFLAIIVYVLSFG